MIVKCSPPKCLAIISGLMTISGSAVAQDKIGCISKSEKKVEIVLGAPKLGQSMDCIEADFTEGLTLCAPVGAYSLLDKKLHRNIVKTTLDKKEVEEWKGRSIKRFDADKGIHFRGWFSRDTDDWNYFYDPKSGTGTLGIVKAGQKQKQWTDYTCTRKR
jgi:hypothetical protein